MNIYLQIVLGICAIASSAGIAFAQFRKGARVESSDLITFYKKEADGYKDMMEKTRNEYTTKHEALLKEVGELRGQLISEKKQKELYEAILKDRNPETEQFMKLMVQSVTDQGVVNKEIVRMIGEIHTTITKS